MSLWVGLSVQIIFVYDGKQLQVVAGAVNLDPDVSC